ncbi:MAG: bacterial Ig-like domain-containing protein [Clostridiales bacterium]|nr:bacterial Ig-like domain-containing protein [Candidatus Cacconaster stercorequi]
MIITNITQSGFSIIQCNGSNNNEYSSWEPCRIGTYTYTWSSYASSTYGKRGIDYIELPNNYSLLDDYIIPTVNFTVDSSYSTPLTAYPAASSGKITVYDMNLNAYGTSTRYIAYNDQCTINAVYTNGYCSVTYPTSSGSNTEYAKLSDFIPNGISHSSWTASSATKTYTKSDMATSFGQIDSGDRCVTVGQSGSLRQVIYPISGGYKLGWIDSNYTPAPKPIEYKDEEKNIGPVASGAFSGKTIIATALNDVDLGYDGSTHRMISSGDICILSNVNSSTALCTVQYPVGASDVTKATTTRTVSNISINNFINYNGSAQAETTTIPEQLTAYPTYAMTHTVGSNTTNWWLDPGDTYTTINKIDGKTEVLYYCSQGAHAGKWKLAWVALDYYYLDLNGFIDGAVNGSLCQYGYADIYVNGILRTKYANNFYIDYPRGSTYEIKNVVAYPGHTYNGLYSGSLKGTLTGNTKVALNFTKDAATLYDIYVSHNPSKQEYLEGSTLNTAGLVVTASYSDGSTRDVTSSCSLSGFNGNAPGVQTVVASYGGKTASFTVTVKSKSPTAISIEAMPAKTRYKVGEIFDASGLKVKATYDNGTSEIISNYDVFADDYITESTGTKNVFVDYCYNDVNVSTSFTITVVEGKVPVITVDDLTVTAGEKFSVPIKLSNNPGIASLKLKVDYDSSLMTLDGVTYNSSMGGNSQAPQKLTSPVTLNWYNGAANYTGNCTFATLTFTALDTLTESKTTNLSITYTDNDVYDITEENLGLTINVGEIVIRPSVQEHVHSYTTKVTAPTCTQRGYTSHTCTCGNYYKDNYTDALGHDWTLTGFGTNTVTGALEFTFSCTRCGATKTETSSEEEHIHSYTAKVTAPTCTMKGYTTHTCACGDSYKDSYTNALGHSWDNGRVTKAATETATGVKTYTCTVCNATKTEVIPILSHTHKYTAKVTAPTCTERGYTTYTCSCGDSYMDNFKAALGHDWDEGYLSSRASYTEEGEMTYTCNDCGATKTETIPMKTLGKPTISVSNTSTGIKVSWDKVTGATGYKLYRRAGSTTGWTLVKTITDGSTSYTNTGRTGGTKYQYKVCAIAQVNGETVNTGAYSSYKTIYRLAQPSISSITNTSDGIKLTWGKVTGATGYKIYRKTGSSTTWTLVKTITSGDTTSYTNTGRTNGTKYTYKVVATKTVSGTTYKSADSATKVMYRLTRPTISSATNSGAGKITVKWNKNSSATGYQVKYVKGDTTKTVKITSNATLSKVLSSLTKGSTYKVYVRSYKTVGSTTYYSAYSAYKSVKVVK